jgi:hypothetical protein
MGHLHSSFLLSPGPVLGSLSALLLVLSLLSLLLAIFVRLDLDP